jgi:hypothetical protein
MELDHWSQISKSIRFKIDLFDEIFDEDVDSNLTSSMDLEDSQPDTMKLGGSFKSGHIVLGSVQKCCLLKQVADAHADDPAFTRFDNNFRQNSPRNSVMKKWIYCLTQVKLCVFKF